MANPGVDATSASARQLIKTRCAQQGWSLCVGAGTSLSVGRAPSPFPMGGELVERLVRRADPSFPLPVSSSALRSFGFDALIQAARNRLAGTEEDFSLALSGVLYADLRAAIGEPGWGGFARCLEALRPGDCQRDEWAARGSAPPPNGCPTDQFRRPASKKFPRLLRHAASGEPRPATPGRGAAGASSP